MRPLISVIIPVYNVAPFIRTCLDSLSAQVFQSWEAVCVDDGSTDGGADILDSYRARDERFVVIHQKNSGVSSARNRALDVAKGDWICFLDGDDAVDRFWLQNYAIIIRDVRPDYIHIEHSDWLAATDVEKSVRAPCPDVEVLTGVDALKWMWGYIPTHGFVADYAVRRVIVGDIRFPIGVRYMEDSLFAMSWLSRVNRCVISKYDGYYYRKRIGSAVTMVFDSEERAVFTEAYIELTDRLNDASAEANRSIMESGLQHLAVAAFFAWISNCKGCLCRHDKQLLHKLAKRIDTSRVKFRWRYLFIVFKKCGLLSPLYITHGLAVKIARILAY
ncbi:MAG: glycosyltransferase [Kiritimatiellae bacterium]|nr:glycosyltransferase [Kiritimatiellia bacterium]